MYDFCIVIIIITLTFLSTSTNYVVADIFSQRDSIDKDKTSIYCLHIIKNLNGIRGALDITITSIFPDEEEVLLLPYSAFQIMKKKSI